MRTTHYSLLTTHSQAGFGLLEVVISAGILATVIGASVGLMNTSLRRATLAGNRATAMNLAQESLELARVARDTTYVDRLANDWTTPFAALSSTEGTIAAAGDSFALSYPQTCDTDGCFYSWQMTKNAASDSFGGGTISNGVETIIVGGQNFQREVYVTEPGINYPNVACLETPEDPSSTCGPTTLSETDVIRKITVIVRWGASITEAVSSIEYLTNWRSS